MRTSKLTSGHYKRLQDRKAAIEKENKKQNLALLGAGIIMAIGILIANLLEIP